ncbi:MAG: hypothetical protein A2046_16470 [Bacteroidetes bacterium GWA2_30_7]|nr:MAG: hypothetical protein A2046_16470 [Bacteroidetes bacterium GWA2_30_7]
MQDSTISKTEKVNNVVIQTDSNEIKPSGNNPPSKRSIYNVSRKKFDSISKTISAQSIKLDASDSDKQNNYIKYRANNKKQLLLEVEKQKE